MVKEFLSQQNIPYRELDVSQDRAAAEEMVAKTGQMGVPVTVIGGEAVIGFDRVRLQGIIQQLKSRRGPAFGAAVADAVRKSRDASPGAYVGNIKTNSAAQRIGLRPGDVIVEINKQKITAAADLVQAINRLGEGNRITVIFLRDGQRKAAEGML